MKVREGTPVTSLTGADLALVTDMIAEAAAAEIHLITLVLRAEKTMTREEIAVIREIRIITSGDMIMIETTVQIVIVLAEKGVIVETIRLIKKWRLTKEIDVIIGGTRESAVEAETKMITDIKISLLETAVRNQNLKPKIQKTKIVTCL